MLGPTLRGKTVSLEPSRPEDAELRRAWFADLALSRTWTGPSVPSLSQELESFERAARDPSLISWRIALDGETIGSSWLVHIDWINRQAWQGMMIGNRDHWGKGYGSEAVRLRTAFAFEELNLERLETSTIDFNIGMHKALQRSGFRQIGLRRHRFFVGGQWHDEPIFELLRADWSREAAASDLYRVTVNFRSL